MRSWKIVAAVLLCLVLLANCGGPAAKVIETPVTDMNLAAEEIGEGYTLSSEQGKEQFTATMTGDELKEFKDGNIRLFMTADNNIAMTGVASMNTVEGAKAEMRGMLSGFEESFTSSMSTVTFNEMDAPNIGEEAVMMKGVESTLGFNLYLLAFRKANVIGIVFTMAADDAAAQALTNDLAAKLDAKIK